MPYVKLKLGNLFDEPTDLVVLPCSTGGTVTNFVANHLREYDIPRPRPGMRLGDVDILPFEGAENVAQFAAFAVSVKGMSSTVDAISEIGESRGMSTHDYDAVRRVSAPLLGAGAGGLRIEDVVEALSRGFKESATEDAVLTIFVLHRNVIDRLRGMRAPEHRLEAASDPNESKISTQHTPIRVFISYSGTSPQHKEWVARLATYLRANGLDARLDQWHLRGGMDLPQWMANELQLADRVIIITDSRYTERADGRVGGVGWETMLIQGDMSSRGTGDHRYIVVVREDHFSSGVPTYLKTKYCIHWASDVDEAALQTDLLKELYNVEKAPAIGEPPVFV
ncbi:MAG: toll/interleukin-1 receptor domain-containing protein [Planctomycetales bacterium]|nr:toll/interleukin-1 receptor domain-containing protein [Planctomycetales bacterium]